MTKHANYTKEHSTRKEEDREDDLYKSKEVEESAICSKNISFINQKNQLGTAHAVKQALPALRKNSICVVLYGDVPLVQKNTLTKLIKSALRGTYLY